MKKYIGDKKFYMAVLAIIVPVIIQNGISNFVSLLDNLMVGAVGQDYMNGVSISNQLVFVYNLFIFGGVSSATIYAAQFYGAKNQSGVRSCFRFALIVAFVLTAIAITLITTCKETLLGLYITPENTEEGLMHAEATLRAGIDYIDVMMLGLPAFALTTVYAGIERVTGETKLPMVASIVSVLTNLFFNWVFIFGHFGISAMNAKGAAIATVIARYVELGIMVIVSHRRTHEYENYGFLDGVYSSLAIPLPLTKKLMVSGLPLVLNEGLWSLGMTVLVQQYSQRGLDVVAALNINSTLANIFNIFFISMGTACSVMVGQALGANEIEEAKDTVNKLIAFQLFICVSFGLLMFVCSPLLPKVFIKATPIAKEIASDLIKVNACVMPINGFAHCAYFILRSGGKTLITFLFDSCYTWVVPVPLALLLASHTSMYIIPMFAIVSFAEIIKDVIGYIMLKKGLWIHNIVVQEES